MGQESFTDAEDQTRSIVQSSSEHPDSKLTCYLLQPNGLPPYEEPVYDGYASIGDMDVFDWLNMANHLGGREQAIHAFHDKARYEQLLFPLKITYNKDLTYENAGCSYSCPHQGLPMRPDKQTAYDQGVDIFLLDDEMFDDIDFSEPVNVSAGKVLVALSSATMSMSGLDRLSDEEGGLSNEERTLLFNTVFSSAFMTELDIETPSKESLQAVLATMGRSDCGGDYSRDAFDDLQIYLKQEVPSLSHKTPSAEEMDSNMPSRRKP